MKNIIRSPSFREYIPRAGDSSGIRIVGEYDERRRRASSSWSYSRLIRRKPRKQGGSRQRGTRPANRVEYKIAARREKDENARFTNSISSFYERGSVELACCFIRIENKRRRRRKKSRSYSFPVLFSAWPSLNSRISEEGEKKPS